MAHGYDVSLNTANFDKLIYSMSEKHLKIASRRAISKTMRKARTFLVSTRTGPMKKNLKGLKTKKAKESFKNLPIQNPGYAVEGSIKISPTKTPFKESYGSVRQVRKGVAATIKSRKVVKGAFIATMKNGKTGVFIREGKGRLPIRMVYSSRAIDVMDRVMKNPPLQAKLQEIFLKEYENQLRIILKGY